MWCPSSWRRRRWGFFYLNSLVIQGSEPVIVDTGTLINRDQWQEQVFSIVDPADVRWIFLSHEDPDHTGNLMPALAACPNAVLVTTWFGVGRMVDHFEIPMDRVRFLRDGDSFDAGDRTLTAVRPRCSTIRPPGACSTPGRASIGHRTPSP